MSELFKKLDNYNLILASKSPRRQQLLKDAGFEFEVRTKEVEENYPKNLKREEIAVFLAELKANAFANELDDNEILITADTIVCLDELILGKPADRNQAIEVLLSLSGKKHDVISGVCLKSNKKTKSFFSDTEVWFKELRLDEITYYIDTYKPYDKAGSYGIQEWIGHIGIPQIKGSYFNVMGLPVQKLYDELCEFVR